MLETQTRRTYSVEEAAKLLGIGRSLAYELARHNELPGVIRLGSRFVVSREVLDRAIACESKQEST